MSTKSRRTRRAGSNSSEGSNKPNSAREPIIRGGVEPYWDQRSLVDFRRRLLAWFRRAARDLPWRRSRDVYRIWVSEIMLQQTQVATVIPYFERFVARFPTVRSLAAADEREVLRHWEGLGYYRRARQLHEAARRIVALHDGEFPSDFDNVIALPGIGRYTAGAILSIAHDQRRPILEANTLRVYSRLLLHEGDPRGATAQHRFWAFAESLLPRKHVGTFNQALMELGSEICRPRQPVCLLCPVQAMCPTSARGWQDRIPAASPKKQYENVTEAAVLVFLDESRSSVLLRRCGDDERWAGLWDFPRFAVPEPGSLSWIHEVPGQVLATTGVAIHGATRIATLKHGVTRYRITLHCLAAQAKENSGQPAETHWVACADLESYPLSTTGRKISRLVKRA